MKKKTIIELVILGVLLSFIAVGAILSRIDNNDIEEGYEVITNGEYEVTLWIDEEYEDVEEEPKELIGNILATYEAHLYSFCNGYGVVKANDTTYIINTEGEIFASFHKDAEWGDILYWASDWNFYDGRAVFISDYGTLAFPIDYDGTGEYYWYKSAESEVVCVNEENLLVVREKVETPEGTIAKIGVQDDYGNWVIESEQIDVNFYSLDKKDKVEYLGNDEFLISHKVAGGDHYYSFHYYLYNISTGTFENLKEKKPETKKYYKNDFKYIDQIDKVLPMTDEVQFLTIKNDHGVNFVTAVDKKGKQLFEPIQCEKIGNYSEGLLGVSIPENGGLKTIYIDKNGVTKIDNIVGLGECKEGIINGAQHYYDKEGNLLFE